MIAYLGPNGTFTERAAQTAFPEFDAEALQPLASIPAVLEAVAIGNADAGVVPVENSIQGTVHVTIDGLLAHPGLEIVKEVLLRIEQHLMVWPGADPDRVSEVWSHPQALAQCREFIRRSGLKEVQYDSTAAAAAELASAERTDVAVIGPEQAALAHRLQVAKRNIADVEENWTRFVVIERLSEIADSRENEKPGNQRQDGIANQKKTMMVVTPYHNFPGVLASILNVFSTLGLNLCWIESRPTRQRLGSYQFFLEIQTGIEDASLRRSLDVLEAYGHRTRIFGSYDSAYPVGADES